MNPVVAWSIGLILSLVAIIATALPGGVISRKLDVHQIHAEVGAIQTAMAPAYLVQPGRYGTAVFNPASLIGKNYIPNSLIGPANTLKNKFGGDVQISGNTAFLNIDYDQLDKGTCVDAISTTPPGGAIKKVTAGATLNSLSAATLYTAPVDPDTAETLCSDASSNAARFVTN